MQELFKKNSSKKTLLIPLFAYLLFLTVKIVGIAFIDSTSIAVCHNKRIGRNKVCKSWAKRGKTTSGWFYVFKLHLIINNKGEILSFQLTPGNISDVSMVETLSKDIFGKLFGDKGYISAEIGKNLFEQGMQLFTTIKANMKQKLMTLKDKLLRGKDLSLKRLTIDSKIFHRPNTRATDVWKIF